MPPPAAEEGVYRARLKEKPFEIRLLQVLGGHLLAANTEPMVCQFKTYALAEAPPFRCLSYCWGVEDWREVKVKAPPSNDLDRMHVTDGEALKTMYVSKNLYGFLQRFRRNPPNPNYPHAYLWIDAICINQGCQFEKDISIPLMGAIYAKAGQTIVWLGWMYDRRGDGSITDFEPKVVDGEVSSQSALVYIREVAKAFRGWTGTEDLSAFSFDHPELYSLLGIRPVDIPTWRAVAAVVSRMWSSRAWVIQEVVLSKSIGVVCGPEVLVWDDFVQFALFLRTTGWYLRIAQYIAATLDATVTFPGWQTRFIEALRQSRMQTPTAHETGLYDSRTLKTLNAWHLLELIITGTRYYDATLPQDKVHAPLALIRQMPQAAGCADLPNPPYSTPVGQLYREIAGSLLQKASKLTLLSHVEDATLRIKSSLPEDVLSELPSWCPDFAYPGSSAFERVTGADYNAMSGRPKRMQLSADGKVLQLHALKFGVITTVPPSFIEGLCAGDFRPALQFCLSLPKLHPNGQDRVEAFWRTLIGDSMDTGSPAAESMAARFKRYMELKTAIFLHGDRVNSKLEEYKGWGEWQIFDLLRKTSDYAARVIPSTEELTALAEDWRDIMVRCGRRVDRAKELVEAGDMEAAEEAEKLVELPRAKELARLSELYASRFSQFLVHRRVFVVEGGCLGLGPMSSRVGDEVWFVAGADVPFVLRPVGESGGERKFTLVGETYVHGYMHGEVLNGRGEGEFEHVFIE